MHFLLLLVQVNPPEQMQGFTLKHLQTTFLLLTVNADGLHTAFATKEGTL